MSETKETHVHVLEDGTVVEHSHGEHGHHHSHAPVSYTHLTLPTNSLV